MGIKMVRRDVFGMATPSAPFMMSTDWKTIDTDAELLKPFADLIATQLGMESGEEFIDEFIQYAESQQDQQADEDDDKTNSDAPQEEAEEKHEVQPQPVEEPVQEEQVQPEEEEEVKPPPKKRGRPPNKNKANPSKAKPKAKAAKKPPTKKQRKPTGDKQPRVLGPLLAMQEHVEAPVATQEDVDDDLPDVNLAKQRAVAIDKLSKHGVHVHDAIDMADATIQGKPVPEPKHPPTKKRRNQDTDQME